MKRFFLLFSAVFVLYILLTSVSFAYTWDDIEQWIEDTADNIANNDNPPTEDLTLWNLFYNNWYSSNRWRIVKTYIGDISNRSSYTFMISCGSDRYLNIAFCNNLGTLSLNNGTIVPEYNATIIKYGFDSQNNTQGSYSSATWSNQSMNKTNKGTFWYNTMLINFSPYYFIGQNLLTFNEGVNSQGWQGIRNNTFYYQFKTGYGWNLSQVDFRLYYLNNNTKIYVTPEHYDIYQTAFDIEERQPGLYGSLPLF